MRSIALFVAILAFSPACKSSAEKNAAKNKNKQLAAPALAAQGDDDDDDGAIEVPKELHSAVYLKPKKNTPAARAPLAREGLPREFPVGSKLQVKLRSVKNLKLGLSSSSKGGKVSLKVEGSNLASLEFEGGEKEFVIPMKGMENETLLIALPGDAPSSLSITQLTALGGEILDWTILSP